MLGFVWINKCTKALEFLLANAYAVLKAAWFVGAYRIHRIGSLLFYINDLKVKSNFPSTKVIASSKNKFSSQWMVRQKEMSFLLFSSNSTLTSIIWILLLRIKISFEMLKTTFKLFHLTHFRPMSPFYTPWKRQKTRGFLKFSGSIEREHWSEMG